MYTTSSFIDFSNNQIAGMINKKSEILKMKNDVDKLLDKHQKLIHTNNIKVESHVQREDGDWYINTLMLENISTPFKYKRKQRYKSLQGQRVNITYYIATENVAGFEIDIMNIVRIKVA